MKPFYITFRSVTFAQQGEKRLQNRNYRCVILRTPRWMEAQGCGYALKLWTNDIRIPVRVLQENKVQMRKIYVQREDGNMEEVNP